VSITDRVLDALKTAIQLEERVTSMARSVSELAREVRDIDKRLVRVEAVIEFGTRGSAGKPRAIEDRSE
jgi:SMC interacting uncharacterized protein involved in chromosome segregation